MPREGESQDRSRRNSGSPLSPNGPATDPPRLARARRYRAPDTSASSPQDGTGQPKPQQLDPPPPGLAPGTRRTVDQPTLRDRQHRERSTHRALAFGREFPVFLALHDLRRDVARRDRQCRNADSLGHPFGPQSPPAALPPESPLGSTMAGTNLRGTNAEKTFS